MKLRLKFPFASSRLPRGTKGGFTLVEIIVAIAILVIIVLLFGQMLATMSKAWTYGKGRANNFTKARAMLDLLSDDIEAGVFRPDLAMFPMSGTADAFTTFGTGSSVATTTVPTYGFYTSRPGVPANQTDPLRSVSVVEYAVLSNTTTTNTLERADKPILWSDSATNIGFGNTNSFPVVPIARDTAPGVIGFRLVFIQADGSYSVTYTPVTTGTTTNTNPSRAVSVSLAVVDDYTFRQLSSTQLSNLTTLLLGSTTLTDSPLKHGIKSYWDTYLNGSSMSWSSYPKGLEAGLATFERNIPLPNAP